VQGKQHRRQEYAKGDQQQDKQAAGGTGKRSF